jgi:hypothetical protein
MQLSVNGAALDPSQTVFDVPNGQLVFNPAPDASGKYDQGTSITVTAYPTVAGSTVILGGVGTVSGNTGTILAHGTKWSMTASITLPLVVPTPTSVPTAAAVPTPAATGAANFVQDGAAPKLEELSFTPTTIDTSSEDAIVTVTLKLTASASEVCINSCIRDNVSHSATQLRFTHVDSGQFRDAYQFTLTSGTMNDGTFEAQITFPRGSSGGRWNVTSIYLVDDFGNQRSLGQPETASLGYLTNSGDGDAEAPILDGFSVTPSTIDTTLGDVTATVTLTARDTGAGLCLSSCRHNSSATQVRFTNVESGEIKDAVPFSLKSGTINDGVFEAQLTFSQGSSGSIWNMTYILLVDDLGTNGWHYP